MPIKPKPYICKCTRCNWEIGIAPKSDALMPWEHFSDCPKCGNDELMTESLSTIKEQLWKILRKISNQV